MANICNNKLYLSSETNIEKWTKELVSFLDANSICYDIDGDSNWVEANFDTKWTFPEKFYEFGKDGEQDGLYIRCLSEEYGCGYVAMNIYDGGEWKEEQCFSV